jgi:peptidoglycan hydrolase-like protein with peptidoglycan-binding domain
VIGGWRLTAINTMASGLPVNLSYNPASDFSVSTVPTYRPNVSGDVYAPDGEQTAANWFNKQNVTIPTDRSQPFGNAPRNAARGPALYTLDMGLHKSVNLVGRSRVEFRIEAFNVLNKTNLGAPNANVSNTNFGTITTLATPARQLQLGLKFDF